MGVASVEDIDKACVFGAGHPMGPFRLNDLTGLDLSYIMAMEAFRALVIRLICRRLRWLSTIVRASMARRRGRAGMNIALVKGD